MKRYHDDEDERPNWFWRLVKGIFVGAVVSGAAMAGISVFVLPPPAPPPPPATAGDTGAPLVVDGIEVASEPAYFGMADAADGGPDAEPSGEAAGDVPAEVLAKADAVASAEASAEAGPIELDGPALLVNAVPFEAAPDVPLVAVVLDDAAADPLLHETLFSLDLPLTIGVLAGGAGDVVTAEAARRAGFEVVAQLPLAAPGEAEGAALEYGLPAEETALRTNMLMRRLPMAVAATRPLAAPTPPNAGVLAAILDVLGPLGFAYLDHGIGPGRSAPVASDGLDRIVGVSRFTVPAAASAAEAHEVLDRAAAEAAENGASVVVAKADEQMLLALQLWAGAADASAAQLAPLSAVIRRQNSGDALPDVAAETATDAPEVPEAPEAMEAPEVMEMSGAAN